MPRDEYTTRKTRRGGTNDEGVRGRKRAVPPPRAAYLKGIFEISSFETKGKIKLVIYFH